jgi:hypothetical protein
MQKYLLPKARNTVTGQTVKQQDLTGARFTMAQRVIAEEVAQQLAQKISDRTGQVWVGIVEEYTPSQRN